MTVQNSLFFEFTYNNQAIVIQRKLKNSKLKFHKAILIYLTLTSTYLSFFFRASRED